MSNKIKYGIKNCHYAKATIASTGAASYGTPTALPGAVSISMDAQGDQDIFYADNIGYYVTSPNNGYEGDLELALIPDRFSASLKIQTVSLSRMPMRNLGILP